MPCSSLAGAARLGFISEFLAKPVVTGFIIGVAVMVIVRQIPKLLGIPGSSGSVVDQLRSIVAQLPETDPLTLAIGAGSILLILLLRRLNPRIPGALVAMVLGILAVSVFGLADAGLAVVGDVATLMPTIGLPEVDLGDLTYLMTGAAGIVFLAVGESIGAARSFAARHHYEIDDDQEMIALGAANTASGLFGGFVADASLSQSATAEASGARTQLSALVTSGLVLATALLLAPLFTNLPWAVLAAIVVDVHAGAHRCRRAAPLLGVATQGCAAGRRSAHRRGDHGRAGRPGHRGAALAADAAAASRSAPPGGAGPDAGRSRRLRRPGPPPRRTRGGWVAASCAWMRRSTSSTPRR